MPRTVPLRYNRLELRYEIVDRCFDDIELTTPERVASFCASMGALPQESVYWIGVDTQKRVVAIREMFRGTTDMCTVSPADIFRSALLMAPTATGMFIVHNHPSGNVEPSDDDLVMFEGVKALGEQLRLPVIDCLIVGQDGAWSSEAGGRVLAPAAYEQRLEPTRDEQASWDEGVGPRALAG